jgi:hypothetical protein
MKLIPTPTAYDLMRFLSKLRPVQRVDGMTPCLEWQASVVGRGYGQFTIDTWPYLAHRVAYEWLGGESIGDGLPQVCHRCDNTRCCNSDHLFAGTQADNMGDKVAKGRAVGQPKGSRHSLAKLTEEQVAMIKRVMSAPKHERPRQRQLARELGVSRSRISEIMSGKIWAHVSAEG